MEAQENKVSRMNEKEFKLEEMKIVEDDRWCPEHMDIYWYIDNFGRVFKDTWNDSHANFNSFYFGNAFKTKEEAEYEAERLKVYRQLRLFSIKGDSDKKCYTIGCDYLAPTIVYLPREGVDIKYAELLFETEKDARDAVEFAGYNKVLKYYLEV